MHSISFPPSCLHRSRHHPSPPSPVTVLFVTSPALFFSPPRSLTPADLQSCLICVARRVPMKERPMLPAHESFTTRQDLQGTTRENQKKKRKKKNAVSPNPKHFSAVTISGKVAAVTYKHFV